MCDTLEGCIIGRSRLDAYTWMSHRSLSSQSTLELRMKNLEQRLDKEEGRITAQLLREQLEQLKHRTVLKKVS